MFRRKGEDTLFDSNTDAAMIPQTSGETAATPTHITAPSAPLSAPGYASAASANGAAHAPAARPVAEQRPSAPQTAAAFRPNASVSDLTRTRMPEVKTPAPTAVLPSSLLPATGVEKSNKSGKRVLTVGNDILLKGEIATCDRLVIEGKVDATLNDVHTVEISEHGSFKGSANIEDAEISGLFEGDLVVRNRLVIYATGKVRGKISYGEIEIARGGELTGDIKTVGGQSGNGTRPVARPATTPAAKEEKAAA